MGIEDSAMKEVWKEILNRLEQKNGYLMEIEQISEKMLQMEVEELEQAMEKRAELLQKVAEEDGCLREMCAVDQRVRDLLNHKELPQNKEEQQLYDGSLKVKATANRIYQGEATLKQYMESKKSQILDKIQQLNKRGGGAIRGYSQVLSTGNQNESKNFSKNF